MPARKAEDVKKDVDAQRKAVAELKKTVKEPRKDLKFREARKELRRLQRRWRQMTGRKLARIKKGPDPKAEEKK